MCKRSGPRGLLELAVRGLRVLDPADLVAVEELRRQGLEPLEALAVDLEVAPRPLVVEPEAAAGNQSAVARVVLQIPQQGLRTSTALASAATVSTRPPDARTKMRSARSRSPMDLPRRAPIADDSASPSSGSRGTSTAASSSRGGGGATRNGTRVPEYSAWAADPNSATRCMSRVRICTSKGYDAPWRRMSTVVCSDW